MNTLPVQRASQLASTGPQTQWLVEGLWSEQAVGILGGEPKCCKSFLALDVAVSVASGAACLRQFPVRRSGPVLLFPAEDSLAVVRLRLEGIAAAAQVPFASLPVEVITAPSLRLDTPTDRSRLSHTVQQLRPILLILDPLIRLHRVDENDASQIAGLLSYLRELQRQFQLAVILVHHARNDARELPAFVRVGRHHVLARIPEPARLESGRLAAGKKFAHTNASLGPSATFFGK